MLALIMRIDEVTKLSSQLSLAWVFVYLTRNRKNALLPKAWDQCFCKASLTSRINASVWLFLWRLKNLPVIYIFF